jgi:CO dehydrogenase/acetyl-CoA synthase alpha subunit
MADMLEDRLQALSIEDQELVSAQNTGHIEWMNKQVPECHQVLKALYRKDDLSTEDLHQIHSICIACRKMTSTGEIN